MKVFFRTWVRRLPSVLAVMAGLALTASAATPTLEQFGYNIRNPGSSWPTLVILANFLFDPSDTNHWRWQDTDVAKYESIFSDPEGWQNANGFKESLTDYLRQVSLGKFSPAKPEVIKIDLDASMSWYPLFAQYQEDWDVTEHNYLSNVVHQAMESGLVNWPAYDTDNNGIVTTSELLVMLLVNEGGGMVRSISVTGTTNTVDFQGKVGMSGYGFSTILHEYIHRLGFGTEVYGLWGQGQLSLNDGLCKMSGSIVHPDAYIKLVFGWSQPRIVSMTAGGVFAVPAANLEQLDAPILLCDTNRGVQEFFLLEYRTHTNSGDCQWERDLPKTPQKTPADRGLVIWHLLHDANNNLRQYADVAYPDAELGWRECEYCRGFVWHNNTANCPSPANFHVHKPSPDDHRLVKNVPDAPGQHGWKYCTRCNLLFYNPRQAYSVCQAGGTHSGSANDYSLLVDVPDLVGHSNWRRCTQCESLFFGGRQDSSVCPWVGTPHIADDLHNYTLIAGWNQPTIMAEGRLATTNGVQFLLGGNEMWPSNSITPYLRWYDGTETRVRCEVYPFALGADNITIAILNETDTWVDFPYVGIEEGTFEHPWNTLAEGLDHTGHGGTLKIKTGSSAETAHINKYMFIRAYNGPATLGRP